MHRVELKEAFQHIHLIFSLSVPNAPCGVESLGFFAGFVAGFVFLMHRVELKAVEPQPHGFHLLFFSVPNAPCGVESRRASTTWLPPPFF